MRTVYLAALLALASCNPTAEEQAAQRAKQLLQEGHPQDALELLQAQGPAAPLSPALREQLFYTYLRLEELERATQTWQGMETPSRSLARALRHRDPLVRRTAARLTTLHPEVVSLRLLQRAAEDSSSEVRGFAVRALGKRGDRKAFKQLFRGLHDADWRVRAEAADAFALFKDPAATQWLVTALDDGDGFVRYRAALALSAVTTPTSAAELPALLSRTTPRQQTYIAVVMAQRGDPQGEAVLLRAAVSTEEELRQAAAAALVAYPSEEARAMLDRLREDPSPRVQRQAEVALGLPRSETVPVR